MICVHCGKEIDNGQAFCPYCGSRVGGDAAPEAKAAKKDPRKLALPVAAVALLAVVGVGLANRMPSIDLQRYVTITAQGYDTLGKLDVSFDTDKLEADYGKRIADSFKKAMNDHKESTYGLSSLAADLYSGSETELFVDYCATGSADKTSGLRNGDVITYSWNESEDEAETLFGVKVKYSDITYTVSGLESIVDESAGITWDKISNVLSNLVSYRGLLEYSARRRSYRPQCELYRQILRNKLLPDCKLQPYPYFKPRKEGH